MLLQISYFKDILNIIHGFYEMKISDTKKTSSTKKKSLFVFSLYIYIYIFMHICMFFNHLLNFL